MDGLHVEHGALVEALGTAAVGDHVLLDAGGAGDAVEHPVLRHQGDALLPDLPLGDAQDVLAVDGGGAGIGDVQVEKHVHQLLLAVALHAGDAQNLAPAQGEGHLVQHLLAPLVDIFQVPHPQDLVPGLGLILLDLQHDVAAHHQAGDLLRRHVLGFMDAHGLSAPEDRHAVGDLHNLVELVRDKDQCISLILQVDQLPEELGCFLCGKDGGGLVQDQDLGAADQSLQDFHLLLHAHGDVHDLGVGVHLQVELPGVFLRDLHGLLLIDEKAGLLGHHAQDHVFRHGEAGDQHEVLVHHADALGDGRRGGGEIDLLSVDPDLARGGLLQAEQHLHQRGLSRAVLAHQRVDLALADVEIHILVGGDAVGIHLGDPLHLNDIFFCHAGGPSRSVIAARWRARRAAGTETALLQGFAGFGARRPGRPAPALSLREFCAQRRNPCGNFAQSAATIRRKGAGDPAPFHGLQRNVGAEAVSRQGWTSVRSWTARSGPPSARAESTVSSPFLMASSAALMAAFRSSLA